MKRKRDRGRRECHDDGGLAIPDCNDGKGCGGFYFWPDEEE